MIKFNVYHSYISSRYIGEALVAAESAMEAAALIREFKESDPDNIRNSRAISDHFTEADVVNNLFSDKKGIIFNSTEYTG